jgi:hypothetical protein
VTLHRVAIRFVQFLLYKLGKHLLNPFLRDCSIEKIEIGDNMTTTTNTGTRDDDCSLQTTYYLSDMYYCFKNFSLIMGLNLRKFYCPECMLFVKLQIYIT